MGISMTELMQDSSAVAVARPTLSRLWHDDSGQDLIEYALVSALVGLAAVSAIKGLSTKISASFNSVGSTLTSSV
jgi:pilus assembly protein Flp/PilA